MQIIADLQLHSRFSRAVSKAMTIPFIAEWARKKGIGLVATGDWTHPMWFREIQRDLEEVGNGLLRLKETIEDRKLKVGVEGRGSMIEKTNPSSTLHHQPLSSTLDHLPSPLFVLATEVSCIYSQGGKGRRIHILIWVPSMASAEKINKEMTKRGCNLLSDGRPIIGLSAIQVAELVLSIEPKALVIPAHAWTPWFSLYGSMSGFNSIDEAFGPFAKNIYAIETGLSSSPSMNWRIKELDNRAILSFSDAHSGPKLGREATVFEIPDGQLSYEAIREAIMATNTTIENRGLKVEVESRESKIEKTHPPSPQPLPSIIHRLPSNHIAYTIEFYPEEGKYHYSGHRVCNIRWGPEETKKNGNMCPVCGKTLIQGVEQRVEELAGRSEVDLQISNIPASPAGRQYPISNTSASIRMIASKAFPKRPPFVMLVPLQEIIAEAIGSPVSSVKVPPIYEQLVNSLGSEFSVLLSAASNEIEHVAGERVAQGVEKVRKGDIVIEPGYDGVFGVVKIWQEGAESLSDFSKKQLTIF